jgi:hypothetical protein
MEKAEKHGHAPAGGFWKPPEGAATVSPRPAGVLSRNIAFRHRILLFVMPFFSLYSRQSFMTDMSACDRPVQVVEKSITDGAN